VILPWFLNTFDKTSEKFNRDCARMSMCFIIWAIRNQINHKMSTISIKAALSGNAAIGSIVTIKGWIRTKRDSKAGISFLHVHDGSCFHPIQVVAPSSLENYDSELLRLNSGCSVICTGILVESAGRGQSVEIQAGEVQVIGWVEDPDTYPIQPKKHSFEFLREVAHLRPRTNTFGAVTRVRNAAAYAIHSYFRERGYFWINTPIITTSDAEGAGEMFRVSTLDLNNLPRTPTGEIDFEKDFFGREAFLTVSGQLNVEGYCLAMSKVYTFGPTFRAENSNTTRHLAEFWMVEPEIAFADLEDLADLSEDFLKYVFRVVLNECKDDMAFFAEQIEPEAINRLENIINKPFVRVNYSEAIDILCDSGQKFEFPPSWGLDLQTEHERFLTEKHFGSPVIIKNYPAEIKAFYMRLNEDGKTVAAMDVLAPGIGEIIGGSQREERLDILCQRLRAMGLEPESYHWYLDLRRYGTVPHAGFGLGFERLVSYITGLPNIRDVIPYPRVPGKAEF
jgi:asparaginyl-tRNA synthetase